MVISAVGLETKNNFAVEGQQQFIISEPELNPEWRTVKWEPSRMGAVEHRNIRESCDYWRLLRSSKYVKI
jgi:hypothetical protein